MSPAYDAGTRAVAYLVGAAATLVLAFSRHLARAVDRPEASAGTIAVLALASLAGVGLTLVVPGAWRIAALALATLPLLWVLSAVAATA
ncbi:hypothetical protein [Nocardioides aquiterrae]|uniref:Iron uptake protein n=1 Tax=Nocardioides aquiterrae TaxID=203799 RepID=A0ABP4F6W3_9ACTN